MIRTELFNAKPMSFDNEQYHALYLSLLGDTNLRINKSRRRDVLPELVLVLSSICNMRCTYCFASYGQYSREAPKYMSLDIAKSAILKSFKAFRYIEVIKLYGGEPTLNSAVVLEICKFLIELKGKGIIEKLPKVGLISNLTNLNQEVIDSITSYGITLFASFDGPKEVHDKQRIFAGGSGSYDNVTENIQKLLFQTGQPEGIECVYTPLHTKSGWTINEIIKILQHTGVKTANVHFVSDFQEFYNQLGDELNVYAQNFRDLQKENLKYRTIELAQGNEFGAHTIKSLFRSLIRGKAKYHCSLGRDTLTVDVNGDIYPCYVLIGLDQYRMGNIWLSEPFGNSSFFLVKKLFIKTQKESSKICPSCDIKDVCGSCPGDMLASHDDLLTPFRISCESQIGMYEGLIEGMAEIWKDRELWEALKVALLTTRPVTGRIDGCISCTRFGGEDDYKRFYGKKGLMRFTNEGMSAIERFEKAMNTIEVR